MILFADLETFSTTPIDQGVDRYSDPAEVLLFAWAIDDLEVNVWDVTQDAEMPAELRACLEDPKCLTVWHNGLGFDRVILRKAMGVDLPVARVHDTAVHALSLALPPSLSGLCSALGLGADQSKDAHGKRLIQLFSKPAPANHTCRRYTAQTHPTEWQHFIDYAKQDVQAMRTCFKSMNTWNYRDNYLDPLALACDTVINERGVQVDTALVRGAIEAVEFDVKRMNSRLAEITQGGVTTGNQRDKMIAHLREHWDLAINDVRADTVRQLLADDTLCDEVREILTIRSYVSTTSTAKYQKLLDSVGTDDRLRYAFRFLGASRSGRWSGRGPQLHNMPRGSLDDDELDAAIESLRTGQYEELPNIMQAASSALRGVFIAKPEHKLVVCDLSNIEGRVLAWLAGEDWKVQAFREFDHGMGSDLYKRAYGAAFGIDPHEVTKEQRQLGKVMELSCGFQGGAMALARAANGFGVDLDELALKVNETIDPAVMKRSRKELKSMEPELGTMSQDAWLAVNALKIAWRQAHENVASFWYQLEEAFTSVVNTPDSVERVGKLTLGYEDDALFIQLPSNRRLWYPAPRVDNTGLGFMTEVNNFWMVTNTYGGKLVENVTQAVARDILAEAMIRAEGRGYPVVMHVHDELVAETPDIAAFNITTLADIMTDQPVWAKGLPLAAAGFECYRYRKD